MTDREFRKLRRSDLVEIIYQLQKDLESLRLENVSLRAENEKTADRKGKGSEKDGTGAAQGCHSFFGTGGRGTEQTGMP